MWLNIVYLELKRRGYGVYVGQIGIHGEMNYDGIRKINALKWMLNEI